MATATNASISPEIGEIPPVAANTTEFRRRIGSISRQSTVYFAGTVLTAATGYFFKIYVARTLGAEKLGLYALGMTLVGFLGLFSTVGLPTAAARFVASYSAQRDFVRLGGFLRGCLALLTIGNLGLAAAVLLVGPWLAVHFYHAPALTPYLWLFALIMVLGALTTFLGQVMAGYQDVTRRTLITHFVGSPGNIVVAVLLISLGFGFGGYMAAQVISAFVVLVLLAVSVWRMTPVLARVAPSLPSLRRVEGDVINFSAAAFGISALEFMLGQADKIVLGHYLDVKQVGIYAVAMALVGFVPIALQSVNQIFSPTIAELHASGNWDLLQQLYSTLTKWILILTIPLSLTLMIFSRPLMGIFGTSFEVGAVVLAVGTVGQLFNCAVGSVGYMLLMSGNQVRVVKIQAVSAILMIASSVVLIPRLGIIGAAISTAATVVIANAWLLAAVYRRLRIFPYRADYFKLVLPTFLSAGVLLLLGRIPTTSYSHLSLVALACVCAYVSFLGTILMSGLQGHDRLVAKIVWTKLRRNFGGNGGSDE
jgi:O-antigen/teichoic acid export membrane protein